MDEAVARRRLIAMLRSAYSGELAAALAYRCHRHAVSDTAERAALAQIERDEWRHRRDVGALLRALGARPQRFRELLMGAVGCGAGASCFLGSWILPMYFAGKLEHANIAEYETGAAYARTLGLAAYERALAEMAGVEREHEAFFLRTVARHPWLPRLRRLFAWADRSSRAPGTPPPAPPRSRTSGAPSHTP
jgi:Ubiquinone biosynthesis protein COQ7